MKILSRDFTLREKILLLFLSILLIGLCYVQFVDRPVRTALENAKVDYDNLNMELSVVNAKVNDLQKKQSELESLQNTGHISIMNSYNNSKEEIQLLNELLEDTEQYDVVFADVTRDGDLIRRNVNIQFVAGNIEKAEQVIMGLYDSSNRCLISDVVVSSFERGEKRDITSQKVEVKVTATFYETMVGGREDAGLPEK